MQALDASWAGIGVQTGATPPQVVLDSASEAPYAVPAEGTVLVFGTALALGRPSIHFSTNRVDVTPKGDIYWTALESPGSITVMAAIDGSSVTCRGK